MARPSRGAGGFLPPSRDVYVDPNSIPRVDQTDWFGPLEPLTPMAPTGVAGRRFNFPVGFNITTLPREEWGDGHGGGSRITFRELRALADNYDLLRLVIETRKDQLAKLTWGIRNKDEDKRQGQDKRIKEVTAFLEMPDREHPWDTWLRALYEDMAVVDAATIYPRRTKGGALYALEIVDGATIKPVIDDHGRRPLPPAPAYQQILQGLPAVDYAADQLFYLPRNFRSNRIYGYPPVEQIIMTVNIALRRQMHQLEFYTSGTMPDALIGVPDQWTPAQIEEFQAYFDALLADNTAERRKVRFVPAGISKGFVQTKAEALKDEYDEWLARITCYAFSVSPQWAVKVMNRATAESAHEEALQEGLAPWQQWGKVSLDRCIREGFGYPDLEFFWDEEDEVDPKSQSDMLLAELARGAITLDEFRAAKGDDPYPDGIGAKPMIYTAAGAVTVESIVNPPAANPEMNPAAPPPGGEEREPAPPRTDRHAMAKAVRMAMPAKPLWIILSDLFAKEATRIAGIIRGMRKAAGDDDAPELDKTSWEEAQEKSRRAIEATALDGVEAGAAEIGVTGITALANPRASAWAKDHAAEFVSKVADVTKAQLAALIAQSEDEGWSVAKLADAIEDATAFSEDRAMRIALHETRTADNQGSLQAWKSAKEIGVAVKKRWVTRGDNVCAVCEANEADGAIDVDDDFQSGDDAAPAHPGCECDTEPVLDASTGGQGEEDEEE